MRVAPTTEPGPVRRAVLHVLDGPHRWGSIEIRADRFGVTRFRLVVYPPGLTDADRRALRIWRGWPLWGALLWIACEMWLSHLTGPWPALAASTLVSLSAGAVAAVLAGEVRTRVHTLVVTVLTGHYDSRTLAMRTRLQSLAGTLIDADACLDERAISPAEYELIWWRVYDQVARQPGAAAGRGAE
jgi:uncharacterized protein DUF6611